MPWLELPGLSSSRPQIVEHPSHMFISAYVHNRELLSLCGWCPRSRRVSFTRTNSSYYAYVLSQLSSRITVKAVLIDIPSNYGLGANILLWVNASIIVKCTSLRNQMLRVILADTSKITKHEFCNVAEAFDCSIMDVETTLVGRSEPCGALSCSDSKS